MTPARETTSLDAGTRGCDHQMETRVSTGIGAQHYAETLCRDTAAEGSVPPLPYEYILGHQAKRRRGQQQHQGRLPQGKVGLQHNARNSS